MDPYTVPVVLLRVWLINTFYYRMICLLHLKDVGTAWSHRGEASFRSHCSCSISIQSQTWREPREFKQHYTVLYIYSILFVCIRGYCYPMSILTLSVLWGFLKMNLCFEYFYQRCIFANIINEQLFCSWWTRCSHTSRITNWPARLPNRFYKKTSVHQAFTTHTNIRYSNRKQC